MSVDDVAVFSFHSEFIQNHVADIFTVAQGVIIAFHFFMSFLVGQEITFEGSHFTLIEGGEFFPHHRYQMKSLANAFSGSSSSAK